MTLGKQMIEQLRLLATGEVTLWRSCQTDGERFTLASAVASRTRRRLSSVDHDRYSVTLRALEITRGAPIVEDARAYLSACAAAIARQLSYLEEPLAVWELDSNEQQAQLRSSPPQRDGEEISYWEVTLWAGEHARRAGDALSLGARHGRARGAGLPGHLRAGRAYWSIAWRRRSRKRRQ